MHFELRDAMATFTLELRGSACGGGTLFAVRSYWQRCVVPKCEDFSMSSGGFPFSVLPVRRVQEDLDDPMPRGVWPATLAPVRQLLDEGLDFGAVTILVGDNGAGKSTLVEAIAMAFGMNPEGGSTGAVHQTRDSESTLAGHLQLARGAGASKRGFFLRAETMHGFFTYLESIQDEGAFHTSSHGEAFIDLVVARSRIRGLWVLDEPESALSVAGCLALLGLLRDIQGNGSQIVISTHSPILAAYPDADLYEIGEWGIRASRYDDLDLVRTWRSFLESPQRYLRHLN
jgi:predicted ATPase